MYSNTFSLFSQPYLDQYNQCYKNIVTLNILPNGPLKQITRQIKLNKLSPFQVEGPCTPIEKCTLALVSLNFNNCIKNGCNLMTPDEIPNLYSFLLSNGYQIETQLTNMMNQGEVKNSNKRLICNITYYGNKQPNITYMR
jgi:hypothetical protein